MARTVSVIADPVAPDHSNIARAMAHVRLMFMSGHFLNRGTNTLVR